MNSIGIWAVPVAVILLLSGSAFAADRFPFRFAVYSPWNFDVNGSWNFSELSQLGVDGFYAPARWTTEIQSPGWMENTLGTQSLLAAANNITFIIGLLFQGESSVPFNYSHAVDYYGDVESYAPSPVGESWWRHMVEEPALFIANLSLHYPIWGVSWDMEGYGHKYLRTPDYYTYDEAAIQAFANETSRAIPFLEPSMRHRWLESNNLLDDYLRWQEIKAYSLAKEIREKVDAINPNLSLGVLDFYGGWLHVNILKGFNSSQVPLTAWGEWTYGGYKIAGREGVDHFLDIFQRYGLNGKFLPGLWSTADVFLVSPWKLMTSMEAALRHNGYLWIYQSWAPPEYEQILRKIYSGVRSNFLLNKPLPIFDLYGRIEGRPYLGPGGSVILLLNRYELELNGNEPHVSLPPDLTLMTENNQIPYMGKNLTLRSLTGPNPAIRASDLPCIVSGLVESDLLLTQAEANLQELEHLSKFNDLIGLGTIPSLDQSLAIARNDLQEARYQEAVAKLAAAKNQTYDAIMEEIWPLVQAAMLSPRNSSIPLNILSEISNAKTLLSEGKTRESQIVVYEALKEWSVAVREHIFLVFVVFLVFPGLQGRLGGSSKKESSNKTSLMQCPTIASEA